MTSVYAGLVDADEALAANLPSVTSAACTGSLTARTGRWNASRKPPARLPVSKARREISGLCFDDGHGALLYDCPSGRRLL